MTRLGAVDGSNGQRGQSRVGSALVPARGRVVAVDIGQVTVVNGLNGPAGAGFDVAAGENPVATKRRQTLLHAAGKVRVAPGPAAIIDPHRFVGCFLSVGQFRGTQRDFPQRHPDGGMHVAGHINAPGIRQVVAAVRFKRIFVRDHNVFS